MNIFPILKAHGRASRALAVGLVGAGEFGATFVAQSLRTPSIRIAAICDRDTEKAKAAAAAAGIPETHYQVCADSQQAQAAIAQGRIAIVSDAATMASLPVTAVLEATGDPAAAAATALAAIEAGKHVVLATKEAEIVVGPELAARAAERGVIHSPVDGDQPSLLIGLVDWARTLGFPVVCAGKSSESDFVFNPETQTLTAWGETVSAADFKRYFCLPGTPGATAGSGLALDDWLGARARGLPWGATTVPDLCEMGIVANHTGLTPDCPSLHAPIARTVELPALFRPRAGGGLLAGAGRVDMFNCLRRPDELSFAGGVFVVIESPDPATGRLFAAKGIPTAGDGRYVLLHNPVHLLGAEAAMSMISAAQLACSSGGVEVKPRVDLIATTTRDLEPGETLRIGFRHAIDGLGYALAAAQPLAEDAPLPYYLAANARLRRHVDRGRPLTLGDVELALPSILYDLRCAQDRRFFEAAR